MKNLLLSIIVITGFAACKSDPNLGNQNRDIRLLSDSTTYQNNILSDTNTLTQVEHIPAKISEGPTEVRKISTKKTTKIRVAAPEVKQINTPPVATPPIATTPSEKPATSVDQNTVKGPVSTAGNETASSGTEPKIEKKKGMKKATQGAIIGGMAGAVGGAVISKKKGLGAVIG